MLQTFVKTQFRLNANIYYFNTYIIIVNFIFDALLKP